MKYLLVVRGVIKGSGTYQQMLQRGQMVSALTLDWEVIELMEAFIGE